MIETKLTELLERAGQRTTVGPPPIDLMHARVARRRRRRTVVVTIAASVAVVAAAGGTVLLIRPSTNSEDTPPPVASTSPGVVPLEMRLVGIGHAAIAVPTEWGMNQTHCVTPHRDTAILTRDGHLCAARRPEGVESVDIGRGRQTLFDLTADEIIEIDGVRAEGRHTTCVEGNGYEVRTCSGGVRIPSLDTWFWAESSTSADEVDRILDRIEIVPDQVGVPAIRPVAGNAPERNGQTYADALTEMGLKPKIQTKKFPGYTPGDLMAISPTAGTMLPVGATVTLTVVAR